MTEKMRDGVIRRGKTYSYVVRERDPQNGKSRPRWVGGFKTAKDAKQARDAARHAVARGTYVAPQDLTVSGWLDRWIAAHEVELKPSTAASYRDNIERYLKPTLGAERLQGLSPSRLTAVFKDLHERGGKNGKPLSARTVEFARAVLRRALADAVVERVIEVNPVIGTRRPPAVKPSHSTWTGEQLRAFLALSQDTRLHPLWTLAAGTGMRRGEILGLRWSEVDLEEAVVSVSSSTTYVGAKRVTTTPKNHERRRVSIDAHVVAVLRAWKRTQSAERLAWGPAYEDTEGLVFTWENGRPLLPDYVTKAFVKAQADYEGPTLTLHELRHTHATVLLRDGVPVHIVAKRLGHKDPSITLQVYADVIPDDDSRALDVFSRAVWGA